MAVSEKTVLRQERHHRRSTAQKINTDPAKPPSITRVHNRDAMMQWDSRNSRRHDFDVFHRLRSHRQHGRCLESVMCVRVLEGGREQGPETRLDLHPNWGRKSTTTTSPISENRGPLRIDYDLSKSFTYIHALLHSMI